MCIPTESFPTGGSIDDAPEAQEWRVPVQAAIEADRLGQRDFAETVGRTERELERAPDWRAERIEAIAPAIHTLTPPVAAEAAAWNKWNTTDLRVYFIDANQTRKIDLVLNTVQEWSKACGLKYTKVNRASDAHIRVSFNPNVNVSLLGPDSVTRNLQISGVPANASMNIDLRGDGRERYLILHEFGHANGLIHEHQHPDRNSLWEFTDAVYSHFATYARWSRQQVQEQILEFLNRNNLFKTGKFDASSIMAYAFDGRLLKSGRAVPEPTELSYYDKVFMAELYGPGTEQPVDPGIGGVGGTGGGGGSVVKQLTLDGPRVDHAITIRGGEAKFEFTISADRSGADHTVGTEGTTQVQLRLFGPDDPAKEIVPVGRDSGTPDLVNHVLRLRLSAGKYVLRASHLSPSGGGSIKAYLMAGRQNILLGRR